MPRERFGSYRKRRRHGHRRRVSDDVGAIELEVDEGAIDVRDGCEIDAVENSGAAARIFRHSRCRERPPGRLAAVAIRDMRTVAEDRLIDAAPGRGQTEISSGEEE